MPNRRSKGAIALFAALVVAVPWHTARAQAPKRQLGLFESLETIVGIDKKRLARAQAESAKNPRNAAELAQAQSVRIAPEFMQSILLHTDRRYLAILSQDKTECSFYALLENGLLRHAHGPVEALQVSILEKGAALPKVGMMTKREYLDRAYSRECFQNKEMGTLFGPQNIKRTVEGLSFQVPKGPRECPAIHKEWLDNNYLPYICRVPELLRRAQEAEAEVVGVDLEEIARRRELKRSIEEARTISSALGHFHRTYLDNLCSNLDSPEGFCAPYLRKDVWGRIIGGEVPIPKMSHRCDNLLRKSTGPQDLPACAAQLTGTPSVCTTVGASAYPSLFPRPDCREISDSLNVSQLSYDYKDCPGVIDNEAITNVHRILMHFRPRTYVSTPENCASEAMTSFARMNLDFKNKKAWPLKICFMDRIDKEEKCRLYIPSADQSNPLSEVVGVARALRKLVNAPNNAQCKMLEEAKYNPNLLEYKSGCYIIYDKRDCTSFRCPKRIIWNSREVTELKYQGVPSFDYVPNSFNNEAQAINTVLTDALKLTSAPIHNLTELKFFMSHSPGRLVHGVGCLEDLLPQLYPRRSFNQCTPMPFIVDGIKDVENATFLSVRTALDDVHSPRLMNWNFVYGALGLYQQLHPLNTWALYGLRK